MDNLKNLIELVFKHLTLKEQAESLYAEAKKIEKDIKNEFENVRTLCGTSGKTIFDFMEDMVNEHRTNENCDK